ncbi:hypothetical protein D3870_02170 [Noviherbaspirillum cavernae]|uniref:Uncharacterized protein n=2 Tax=Noviherbaspirillum cavernae TaxID=2320862 RepID=A0A418WXM6_9BURK|nr:hypothetical protein D3870_02170 [Noviherbaspirillum cavernae]
MAALSVNAECRITSVRGDDIAAAFKRHGGWKFSEQKYNSLCAKLNRAKARIQINAMATVLANQSIGWATLSVIDFDTGIATGDFASMNTQVNTYASQDKANEIMVDAINAAAENWDGIDSALASLEAERKKVRNTQRK